MTGKPTTARTWDYFFGPLTGKRNPKRNIRTAQWQQLTEDIWFDGYEYAAGSEFKVFETQDFGFVCFKPGSLTPQGHRPGRLIHKY